MLDDRPWVLATAIAGVVALGSYFLLIVLPDSTPAIPVVLVAGFAFGWSVVSLGLHHIIGLRTAPRLSLAATAANLLAGALLMAMGLVQLAVKATDAHPGATLAAVWLGLDVAWDLYGGAGTFLFTLCMFRDRRFGSWLALPGLLVVTLLLVLNVATFPTPPAEAGWFDAGPLVGLWYLAVTIRVAFLLRAPASASA